MLHAKFLMKKVRKNQMSCVYTSVYVGISNWFYSYWYIGEVVVWNVGLAEICKPQESIVCPDWTWGADFVPN